MAFKVNRLYLAQKCILKKHFKMQSREDEKPTKYFRTVKKKTRICRVGGGENFFWRGGNEFCGENFPTNKKKWYRWKNLYNVNNKRLYVKQKMLYLKVEQKQGYKKGASR